MKFSPEKMTVNRIVIIDPSIAIEETLNDMVVLLYNKIR
jgi:hypothetical protein